MSKETPQENLLANLTYRKAIPKENMDALSLIFQDDEGKGQSYARQFILNAAKEGSSLEWIFVAVDEQASIHYAVLFIPRPGRTGVSFLAKPKLRKDIEPMGKLMQYAMTALPEADFNLMQALIEPEDDLYQLAFRAADYQPMATLSYMRLSLFEKPSPPQMPEGFTISHYDEHRKAELGRVLESSYIDTLDCPDLRGLRSIDEIIASHKAAGQFDPQHWLLLEKDEKAVGCLLLNRVPDYRCIELVYLGLAPEIRGQGLAQKLIEHGLSHCWQMKEKIITLAVDTENLPALHLYQKFGFFSVARKLALLRTLKKVTDS